MPVCEALTTFGRASARGDWGDAGTGAGLELAAGATYANRARRLHASIGIRSLATHSISGYEEYGGDVSFSFLPRPDGTGLQVALSSKHGETAAGGGNSGWLRDFDWHDGGRRPPAWRTKARLGYGSSAFGGVAQPFMERNTGRTGRDTRIGLHFKRAAVAGRRIDAEITVGYGSLFGNYLGLSCNAVF